VFIFGINCQAYIETNCQAYIGNKLPKINCQAYIEYADEMMRTKQGCVRMKIEIIKGI
jgi:hypothetical protein